MKLTEHIDKIPNEEDPRHHNRKYYTDENGKLQGKEIWYDGDDETKNIIHICHWKDNVMYGYYGNPNKKLLYHFDGETLRKEEYFKARVIKQRFEQK